MSDELLNLLATRAADRRPLRVGLIGADPAGLRMLAQARRMAGLHVLGVADPAPERARAALLGLGWPEAQLGAASLGAALSSGTTHLGADAAALIAASGLDVLVEASDVPAAGLAHCLLAIEYGRHIVMASIQTEALVGPLLARRAAAAGLVYSLAYGDAPALIAEQVAWARACGLEVVCAGRGARFIPAYRQSTPTTLWEHAGPDEARSDLDAPQLRRLNAALDGTRAALELAAAANACDLVPQPAGLRFPPCGADDLAQLMRPAALGGALAHAGTVEVAADRSPDGAPVARPLGQGVFVSFAIPDEAARRELEAAGLPCDDRGAHAALYRPALLGGLELLVSVLRVGLRGLPTGRPTGLRGDVVAVVRADLAAGQVLDGAGGHSVYGLLLPAASSLAEGCLPIGLAREVALRHPIAAGQILRWDDVFYEPTNPTVRMRRLMERTLGA